MGKSNRSERLTKLDWDAAATLDSKCCECRKLRKTVQCTYELHMDQLVRLCKSCMITHYAMHELAGHRPDNEDMHWLKTDWQWARTAD